MNELARGTRAPVQPPLPGAQAIVTPTTRRGLSPINRRRLSNFRRNRLGFWSFAIFLALFVVSLFADQLRREGAPLHTIPVIGHAQAGGNGFFDDAGYPVGAGWDEVAFPDLGDPNAYALEIAGDSMEPVYRDGDIVVVSPAASLRRGDRVIARTGEGEVLAKWLARRSARRVELHSFNPAHPARILERGEVDWIARIVWASQ